MDRIIRCITTDGSLMAAAIDSTNIVYTAQCIHKTSAVATAALGRMLTASSIMGAMLKKEDANVTLKINGGGLLGSVVAIADSHGNCRGYVDNPNLNLPLKENGKLDVGTAVGKNGLFCVMRDSGDGKPYIGQVEIVSGEIAEDITNYYATSEQIPTVCALGVLVDKDSHELLLSGGLLIQVLPGADNSAITQLEKNISVLEPVTTMLAKGMNIEEMCKLALDGFEMEVLDEFNVGYACNCSKARVERAIATLKPDDIRTLADDKGYMEAKCQYCGKSYHLSKEELNDIADKQKEEKNQKNKKMLNKVLTFITRYSII